MSNILCFSNGFFYRVDLCHQANDDYDDDEESSSQEVLLDKTLNKPSSSKTDGHRKCFPLRFHHVGSRQKIVMLVWQHWIASCWVLFLDYSLYYCHVLIGKLKVSNSIVNSVLIYQVIVLVFIVMIACAVIIWIGMAKNIVDSAVVARVWTQYFEFYFSLLILS